LYGGAGCNPSTQKTEAGASEVPGQPGLPGRILTLPSQRDVIKKTKQNKPMKASQTYVTIYLTNDFKYFLYQVRSRQTNLNFSFPTLYSESKSLKFLL
jgi:hypothetical protein